MIIIIVINMILPIIVTAIIIIVELFLNLCCTHSALVPILHFQLANHFHPEQIDGRALSRLFIAEWCGVQLLRQWLDLNIFFRNLFIVFLFKIAF